MKLAGFHARIEYFHAVSGVTVRAIGQFTDEELSFRPQPGMRSAGELIFHLCAQEKALAEACPAGKMTAEDASAMVPETQPAPADLARVDTVAGAQAFARDCHQAATAAWMSLTEETLNRDVESPFGTYPAWKFFNFAYDEHWHHRGQLYTYLRLLGKEPVMLYDYQ